MPTKVNDIVNRLNRSKKELNPDLSAEKDAYDKEVKLKIHPAWKEKKALPLCRPAGTIAKCKRP